MAEEETITLAQKSGDRLALDHGGELAIYGSQKQAAIQHVIQSSEQQPIVHMVCWDQQDPCAVDVHGRVTLAGDEKSPIRLQMIQEKPCGVEVSGGVTLSGDERSPLRVRMAHFFETPHVQEHHVATRLSEPIHPALQMRTPLELRFCNPWHLASDYVMEVKLADNRLLSVRLTGATVASPQPCAGDKPCPPAPETPVHS